MVELLQREYSLVVLKVTLTPTGAVPLAHIRLVTNDGGRQQSVDEWTFASTEFRAPSPSADSEPLRVPERLRSKLQPAVQSAFSSRPRPGPVLWLQLIRPFGYLGAVPWERDLHDVLPVALVRLPDLVPHPQMRSQTHVAVVDVRPNAAFVTRPELVHQMKETVDRSLFFAADVAGRRYDGPPDADGLAEWLRASVLPDGVDVLHLLVDGAFDPRGSVVNVGTDDPVALFQLTPSQLLQHAIGVGADVVVLTATRPGAPTTGVRMVGDELGARLAGAVVVHDANLDRDSTAIEGAYKFLLGAEENTAPSPSPAITLYCQPQRVVARTTLTDAEEVLRAFTIRRSIEEPVDVAAHQRVARQYLAQWLAEVARFRLRAADQATRSDVAAYYDGVEASIEILEAEIEE